MNIGRIFKAGVPKAAPAKAGPAQAKARLHAGVLRPGWRRLINKFLSATQS